MHRGTEQIALNRQSHLVTPCLIDLSELLIVLECLVQNWIHYSENKGWQGSKHRAEVEHKGWRWLNSQQQNLPHAQRSQKSLWHGPTAKASGGDCSSIQELEKSHYHCFILI